jgi:hypothetical protein
LVRPVIDAAMAPLKARLKRHPGKPLRPDTLIDARRVWRSLGGYGHIGCSADIEDRYQPHFTLMRISAIRLSTALWNGDANDGVAVSMVTTRVVGGQLITRPVIMAAASLHGLGRRIERGWNRDDEAVFSDLAELGWHFPKMLNDVGERFLVPVNGGQWAGSMLVLDGLPSALASTFLNDGQPDVPVPRAVDQDIEALAASLPEMFLAG